MSEEESANDTAADVGIMLELPGLYTGLDAFDRSLEEMVARAAERGCAPTNHASTTFGPTEPQGLARTHKRAAVGP